MRGGNTDTTSGGCLASCDGTSSTSPAVFVNAVTYQRGVAGQIRSVGSVYDQSREYRYDILGRVIGDQIVGGLGVLESKRSYTFTDSGDLKTVTGTTAGMDVGSAYTYDSLHRLKTAVRDSGGTSSMTYSKGGNISIASIAGGGEAVWRVSLYYYNGEDPQAVSQINDISRGLYGLRVAVLEYDKAGNTTRRYGNLVGTDTSYRWDGNDRMIAADDGTVEEIYHYDHTGQRYMVVRPDGVRYWFAEREFHYKSNGVVKEYMNLSHGGSTGARVEDNNKIELQHHDAMNSLMLSIGDTGLVTAAFRYSAFGEVLESIGDDDHRRQFNDKEKDKHTGLRYYGARYYDPLLLRWTAGDPLYRFAPEAGFTESQRQNVYAFSMNNPLRYYDPDGRSPAATADTMRLGAMLGSGAAAAAGGCVASVVCIPVLAGIAVIAVGTAIYLDQKQDSDAAQQAADAARETWDTTVNSISKANVRALSITIVPTDTGISTADSVDGEGSGEPPAREPGDKMSEGATLDDATDQVTGIGQAEAEKKKKKNRNFDDGTSGAKQQEIDTKRGKSEQELKNRLKRLQPEDVVDD